MSNPKLDPRAAALKKLHAAAADIAEPLEMLRQAIETFREARLAAAGIATDIRHEMVDAQMTMMAHVGHVLGVKPYGGFGEAFAKWIDKLPKV